MAGERPGRSLRVVRVDAQERVYPDRPAVAAEYVEPVAVPRGECVAFQFVISASEPLTVRVKAGLCRADGSGVLQAATTVYEVLPVHVEANTRQAGTKVGKPAEQRHREFLIREAPFDVAEVLAPTGSLSVRPGTNSVVLVDAHIPRDADSGRYDGVLTVEARDRRIETPFAVDAFGVTVPDSARLVASHWFSALPEELTGAPAPQPWSEEHWALIAKIARQLRSYGDTAVHTLLIAGPDPMIQTIRKPDGSFDFDFSRFGRWVHTFLDAGYTTIDGASVAGGHWITPGNTFALDEASGKIVQIFRRGQGLEELRALRQQYEWPEYRDRFAASPGYRRHVEEYGRFLARLFTKLHAYLVHNAWVDVYRQGLLDEPRTVQDYAFLSTLCREHMPEVRIADAIHGYGVDDYEAFSPYVDLWIMEMNILRQQKSQQIIVERRTRGLSTGVYVLGKASVWPNRLLDHPLSDNRTQPWLIHLYGAEYYIHWAANRYRGVADPYRHSIGPTGPLPPGRTFTEQGHAPGNNWLLFPGPGGLRSSMRMLAFRDGALDFALLRMLAAQDADAAAEIVRSVARSATDYETAPAAHHRARRAVLEALVSPRRTAE